ncbi:toxin-antitoxin system YwqK family antitoxin [Brumimicrobium oceani]|uniref:Toxin-antitoxin system YwqK family antitoxin n=1 Tax=Brumimicrobium oceani TaxID=2100725 RepID=A0A2U2XET1_9FLAO|nr:hypothetical protein [Brumimicrobium oceani]PWH86309.1 hypothetical protein DIT68_03465 [Brumimicrobium oceani]
MKIQHKFLLLLLFLLFFSVSSFSQQGKNYQTAFKSSDGTDTLVQEVILGELFNKEIWIIRNEVKDTLEISEVKKGKLHGEQKLFFIDGELKLIANYKKGLLSGKVDFFELRTGQLSRTDYYKALPKKDFSVLQRMTTYQHNNTNIREEYKYKNGLKNGKYTIYHINGEIREKGTFQNDLYIGNKIVFHKNGKTRSDENFIIIDNPKYISAIQTQKDEFGESKPEEIVHIPKKLSVLDGNVKYYHYDGNISSDLNYVKGQKHGICKEYHQDKNSTLKSEVEYKDGLPHGSYIHYSANGHKEREGIFYGEIQLGDTIYKNVYEGEILTYYNGILFRKEHWENFMKNGVQETYSQHNGKLNKREHLKDNLKSGIQERFDSEGLKNYEAHFEIVEVDGKKVSQKTGIETYWDKGKIRSTTTWIDGKKEGKTMTYYANGQIEKEMYFKNGELDGLYKSYYENGQLKEDYMYHRVYSSRKHIGWNKTYDESGKLTRIFHADGNDRNSIGLNYENGKLKELSVTDALNLKISLDHKLKSIHWLRHSRPTFGFNLFTNQLLRRIHFIADKHYTNTANFTSNGELNQVFTSTGQPIDEENINTIAKKIAAQYNPEWNNEELITKGFRDGIHQWNYKNGSPFFKIEFNDSLPNGTWVSYNPIDGDTLSHAEYKNGLPIGKWVEKTVDGVIKSRKSYFQNHQIKESYSYANEGLLREVRKYDSLGKEHYFADYYENGNLKNMREPELSNSITMWDNGDTSYFNFLYTIGDSIKIERQFYKGNILKLQRKNNFTTGFGEVKTFYENGQLKTSHELKDNKSHGLYQNKDENGRLLNTGYFKEGKRNGEWIKYDENGEAEISLFENGEIIIDKSTEDPNSCRCYDKSLKSGKIGYAGSLSRLEEYENIKDFIPKTIIPIDSFNYENIFYVGLQTDNNRSAGFTSMKLLMFREFAFHYPAANQLKFNLNPCKTEGYISNIEGNFNYNYYNKKTVHAYLGTKTIAIGLQQNPMVNLNNEPYTIQFETKGMDFDEKDIKSIQFIDEDSTCYPLGIINNFMNIEISKAELDIHPSRGKYADVPLLSNQSQQFYGFNITEAKVDFDYINGEDSVQIKANANRIVAGANYVAGKLEVEGKSENANEFTPKNSKTTISTEELRRFLEQKGFYRVKTEIKDGLLLIEFYTEK